MYVLELLNDFKTLFNQNYTNIYLKIVVNYRLDRDQQYHNIYNNGKYENFYRSMYKAKLKTSHISWMNECQTNIRDNVKY